VFGSETGIDCIVFNIFITLKICYYSSSFRKDNGNIGLSIIMRLNNELVNNIHRILETLKLKITKQSPV
jgi:hypothetical protein